MRVELNWIPLVIALAVAAACGGGGANTSLPAEGVLTEGEGSAPTVPVPDDPGMPQPQPTSTLDQNRALWAAAGITNYRYTLQRGWFAPPALTDPVIVEVRGGVVVSRKYVATGLPTPPANASNWPSLDGLFDVLTGAYARGENVTVQYHPTLGYPVEADIDPLPGLVDDEYSFNATGLVVLP